MEPSDLEKAPFIEITPAALVTMGVQSAPGMH